MSRAMRGPIVDCARLGDDGSPERLIGTSEQSIMKIAKHPAVDKAVRIVTKRDARIEVLAYE
jgi:hypothetical protein